MLGAVPLSRARHERDVGSSRGGLDFVYAGRIVEGPTVEWEDTRTAYGECRMGAIGLVDGREYLVVYTDRPASRHIISARKANEREQRAYRAVHP